MAPDKSAGLTPVSQGDGIFTVEEAGGQPALRADTYLYFRIDDEFASDLPADLDECLVVRATLLDEAPGTVGLQYDGHPEGANDGRFRSANSRRITGSGEWIDVEFELPHPKLAGRMNYRSDIRFTHSQGIRLLVRSVSLKRLSAALQPQVPRLLMPGADMTLANSGGTWGFKWTPVRGASGYQLVVAKTGAARAVIDQVVNATSFQFPLRGTIAGPNRQGWQWKVRPIVNGRPGEWSNPRAFEVVAP